MEIRYGQIVGWLLTIATAGGQVVRADEFLQVRRSDHSQIRAFGRTQFVPDTETASSSGSVSFGFSSALSEKTQGNSVEADLNASEFNLQTLHQKATAANTESNRSELAEKKPEQPKRRVLVFKAVWCGACQGLNYEFPKLEAVRWKIGATESNHFQLVDADERPDLMSKYSVSSLPTILLVENDREVSRHGYLGAFDLAELYYRRLQ